LASVPEYDVSPKMPTICFRTSESEFKISRASRSALNTGTPNDPKILATSDLPAPIPPVRPITNGLIILFSNEFLLIYYTTRRNCRFLYSKFRRTRVYDNHSIQYLNYFSMDTANGYHLRALS